MSRRVGRPRINPDEIRISTTVSFSHTLLDKIDEIRGDMPRSTYISDVLAQHVGFKQVGY